MFGIVSGSRVLSQFILLYKTYRDICVTTAGSIIVESMNIKRKFLPKNLNLAKPNATKVAERGTAIELKRITSSVCTNAIP